MSTLRAITDLVQLTDPAIHIGKQALIYVLKINKDGKTYNIQQNMENAVRHTDLDQSVKDVCIRAAKIAQQDTSYSNAMQKLYLACGKIF